MARKRRKEGVGMSLFSFLDIMTATMGTLILILICITLIAMNKDKKDINIKIKSDKQELLIKHPIFIECTKDKLIINPQLLETKLADIPDRRSYFMRMLYNLDRNQRYLIFAIRPDGYEIFKRGRAVAEGMDMDIGFEPVDQYWQIKLSKDDLPAPMPGL